jgi:hypothetical protein
MSDDPTPVPRLVQVEAESDHEIRLQYEDGTAGTVDLSEELGSSGVFESLREPAAFRAVRLGEFGQVEWPGGGELCPDALYLRLVGRSPQDVFPRLSRQPTDA